MRRRLLRRTLALASAASRHCMRVLQFVTVWISDENCGETGQVRGRAPAPHTNPPSLHTRGSHQPSLLHWQARYHPRPLLPGLPPVPHEMPRSPSRIAQEWPGSFCDTKRGCKWPAVEPDPQGWLLHGLWPEFNNGSWPQYCDPSAPFNMTAIQVRIHQTSLDHSFILSFLPSHRSPSLSISISCVCMSPAHCRACFTIGKDAQKQRLCRR
jgi:hypothetical protein